MAKEDIKYYPITYSNPTSPVAFLNDLIRESQDPLSVLGPETILPTRSLNLVPDFFYKKAIHE